MKTTDFTKKPTAKKLKENFQKTFGQTLNLEKYTREQLEDFRNKMRTTMSQFEGTNKFNASLTDEAYQRNKYLLDILNTHLAETKSVNENVDQKKAAVIQSAFDMQNKVKNMLEDIGSMMTKTMVALSDDIKENMSPEASEQFTTLITPALQAGFDSLKSTRQVIEQGVAILTGESAGMPMIGSEPGAAAPAAGGVDALGAPGAAGAPAPEGELPVTPDLMNSAPEGDEFGASDAAAGGPEIAGRAKRESRIFRKPSLAESNNLMIKLSR
jgi:hypothetical protein